MKESLAWLIRSAEQFYIMLRPTLSLFTATVLKWGPSDFDNHYFLLGLLMKGRVKVGWIYDAGDSGIIPKLQGLGLRLSSAENSLGFNITS